MSFGPLVSRGQLLRYQNPLLAKPDRGRRGETLTTGSCTLHFCNGYHAFATMGLATAQIRRWGFAPNALATCKPAS